MNNNDIPVWEKYTLTIEEASKYFRIGENKLRRVFNGKGVFFPYRNIVVIHQMPPFPCFVSYWI